MFNYLFKHNMWLATELYEGKPSLNILNMDRYEYLKHTDIDCNLKFCYKN